MRTNIVALPADVTRPELAHSIHPDHIRRGQLLYPVVDAGRRLLGVVTRRDLQAFLEEQS